MRLKDLQVGEFYAKEFDYGRKVLRVRVDEIEKRGRSYEAVTISYGRGFRETQRLPLTWHSVGHQFLGPWAEYRQQELERKELRNRLIDMRHRLNKAVEPIGLDCRVSEGSMHIYGNLDQLDELVRCLEEAGIDSAKTSALAKLLGS